MISLTGWAWGARVLRAQTMSLRNRDFVEASRIIGEKRWRIMLSEVAPNLLPVLASSLLFTVLYSIGAYVTLAYIGLTSTSVWNWGTMLFWAQANNAPLSGEWYWFVPPGICIALVGTGLALLNFGIDEFINPRLRESGLTARQRRRWASHGAFVSASRPFFATPCRPCTPWGPRKRRHEHRRARAPRSGRRRSRTSRVRPAPRARASASCEINDFCVDYGVDEGAVRAVDGVDLHLDRSKVLGIAGESGSGKSTLVYGVHEAAARPRHHHRRHGVLQLSVRATRADPTNISTSSPPTRRQLRRVRWSQISVVIQSALNALNPVVRVGTGSTRCSRRTVATMSRADRREGRGVARRWSDSNEDRLQRFPHELSGGQRQRVMIALALALEPKLVIMDEPTTALDVVTQREILDELAELRARFGFAMIFITHDLSLLVELADEIVVMYAGRLVERASARELYDAPRHPYTLGLSNSFPPMHGERAELVGHPRLAHRTSPTCRPAAAFIRAAPTRWTGARPTDRRLRSSTGTIGYVACWLHVDEVHATVPVELRRAVPTGPAGQEGAT